MPVYDAAGNMTYGPRPGDEGDAADALVLVYDAWNRLVAAYDDDNSNGNADTRPPVIPGRLPRTRP